MSYHDLYITTNEIPRTSISDLPFGVEVSCDRTTGWVVYYKQFKKEPVCMGSEFDEENWLVLDVKGTIIVDSRSKECQKTR